MAVMRTPVAIVGDAHPQPVAVTPGDDPDGGCTGVLGNVGQGFGDGEVGNRLYRWAAPRLDLHVECDGHR